MKFLPFLLLFYTGCYNLYSQSTTYSNIYNGDSTGITSKIVGYIPDYHSDAYLLQTLIGLDSYDGLYRSAALSKLDDLGKIVLSDTTENFIVNGIGALHHYNDKLLMIGWPQTDENENTLLSTRFYSKQLNYLGSAELIIEGIRSFQQRGSKSYDGKLYLFGDGFSSVVGVEIGVVAIIDLSNFSLIDTIILDYGTRKNNALSVVEKSNGDIIVSTFYRHKFDTDRDPPKGNQIIRFDKDAIPIDTFAYEGSGNTAPINLSGNEDLLIWDRRDIVNTSNIFDAWVYKLEGNFLDSLLEASQAPLDVYNYRTYDAYEIMEMSNGDILVGGRVITRELYSRGCFRENAFLARFDKNFNPLWSRVYVVTDDAEMSNNDHCKWGRFLSLHETPEGDIIAMGDLFTILNTSSGFNREEGWLVRTDANGCLNGMGCESVIDLSESMDSTRPSLFSPGYQWNQYTFTGGNTSTSGFTSRYRFGQFTELVEGDYYYPLLESRSESAEDFVDSGIRLKERDGKIYYLNPDRDETPITDDADFLLYDFTAEVGDTITYEPILVDEQLFNEEYKVVVTGIDSVSLLNGERRKRWQLSCIDRINVDAPWLTYLEGMGSPEGLFAPLELNCQVAGLSNRPLLCYSLFGETMFGPVNNLISMPDSCFIANTVANAEPYKKATSFLTVYPNPSNNEVTIQGVEPSRSELFNGAGKLVRTFGRSKRIIVADLSPGIYLLKVYQADGSLGLARMVVQ